ncbi:MAG: hypothetical protein QOK15_1354 [Nocardioidaceae bacterium]|jgi:hypothetical protein|nr:hypothetical protein [Nocardioidaceae bacterium]
MLAFIALVTRQRRPDLASTVVVPPADPAVPSLAAAPWQVFADGSALELREPSPRQLRDLDAGTAVVLVSDRPLSRWRLRRTAQLGGVRIDRELIAIPHSRRPQVVLDDSSVAVHHFWANVAMVPPGVAGLAGAAELALRAARLLPSSWTGALAPGRVLVGRKR